MTEQSSDESLQNRHGDIETVINRGVRPNEQSKPAFYAVTGSHIYGFPSEKGGDVDVRGFHLADGDRYLCLDTPQEQYIINQDGTTEGFEAYADIDLVSYELKKFTSLLYTANYNVLEVVFCGHEVLNGIPLEMESLRTLIEEQLPMDVPKTYFGMAKSNYWKFLNPEKGKYRPTAKKYLYVIRGLLASEFVRQEATITADITELTSWYDDPELTRIVNELIDAKHDHETAEIEGMELADDADEWIPRLFNEAEPPEQADKETYKSALDDWMLKVRS